MLHIKNPELPAIVVDEDMYAPPSDRYYATFGELDLGSVTGPTPLDAVEA